MKIEYLKPLILKIKDGISADDSNSIIDKIVDAHLNGSDAIIPLIYSNGGGIIDALKIYEILKSSPLPTIGIVLGDAKSAAAIILQGCEQRCSLSYSRFVIHRIYNEEKIKITSNINIEKLSLEIKGLATKQKEVDDELVKILKDRCFLENEEINKLLDSQETLSPEEALKIGLIDRIIKPDEKILKILLPQKPAK